MSFEDLTPETFEEPEAGVEDQEPAEPETETQETGVEDPEVAAPESESEESDNKAADAAFAKMRRRAEEAERKEAEAQAELEKLKAKQEARVAALANMGVDDIDAMAEATGMTRDEVLDTIQREEEAAEAEIRDKEKDLKIQELEDQIIAERAEREMAEDLAELQKIDPELKSLDDLGDDFPAYIAAGLSAKQAYAAIKSMESAMKPTPATPPGKISETTPPEKDYFTEDEVDNMTPAQQKANYKKILASMKKW